MCIFTLGIWLSVQREFCCCCWYADKHTSIIACHHLHNNNQHDSLIVHHYLLNGGLFGLSVGLDKGPNVWVDIGWSNVSHGPVIPSVASSLIMFCCSSRFTTILVVFVSSTEDSSIEVWHSAQRVGNIMPWHMISVEMFQTRQPSERQNQVLHFLQEVHKTRGIFHDRGHDLLT